MESSGLDLGKILKMVTENPAMLQTALSFAGKLKDNMGGAENTPKDSAPSNISPHPPASAPPSLPVIGKQDSDNRAREDERRLLMALRPYLNETRREKIDFVLKILQLLELAGNLGLSFDIKPKGG